MTKKHLELPANRSKTSAVTPSFYCKFSMAYMAANCAKLSKGITLMIAKMKSVSHSSAPKACSSTFMLKWLFCNQHRNLCFKVSIFSKNDKNMRKDLFREQFRWMKQSWSNKVINRPWNCILISLSYRPEKLNTLEKNIPFCFRCVCLHYTLCVAHALLMHDCQLTYRNSLYFKLPGWNWYEKG